MSAYIKNIFRSIKHNLGKLISLTFIAIIGIAFVAGLGTLSSTIEASYSASFHDHKVAELTIKSTNVSGFTEKEISQIEETEGVSAVSALTSVDLALTLPDMDEVVNTRLYVIPDDPMDITTLDLVDGAWPDEPYEIMVERHNESLTAHEVGDTIHVTYPLEIFGQQIPITFNLTVSGIVGNPLILLKTGEPMLTNPDETLNDIIYITESSFPSFISSLYGAIPKTDVYVRVTINDSSTLTFAESDYSYYSHHYLDRVNEVKERVNALGIEAEVLTLEQNASYMTLGGYCDKIDVIALIFPLFFILVVALVVLTTMVRTVDEERPQIACMKSLGMSDKKIVMKYVFMALSATLIAAGVGLAIGLPVLPSVIYPAFSTLLYSPEMVWILSPVAGIIAALGIILVSVIVTIYVVLKQLKERPASLLLPKAPKAGHKTWIEKIKIIWNHLSFKYKSCLRNIFRYKTHLIMTIISVAGSTALVFAGLGLVDIANALEGGNYATLKDTIGPIATVVVVFALLLTVFVVYNLTNMNIGERERELATLKVLGYKDHEVTMYIYREIFIMAVMGIIIGLGLGCLLIWFLTYYLEFGALSDVQWWNYIGSALLVVAFIFIVDALLTPKILKIDMTGSLKSVE